MALGWGVGGGSLGLGSTERWSHHLPCGSSVQQFTSFLTPRWGLEDSCLSSCALFGSPFRCPPTCFMPNGVLERQGH